MKVACVGEAMIELSFRGPGQEGARIAYAGDTLNAAIYLKRAWGGAVDYVTALGADPFSDAALGFMAGEGLGVGRIARDPGRLPGLYAITTDAEGERSFHYWREASAARRLFQGPDGLDFSALEGFGVIYLSAITLAILPEAVRGALADWLQAARGRGVKLAFDSNWRPRLWPSVEAGREWVARFWRLTDVALPSVDDEMALFGDADEAAALARLRGYGLADGALKRGAQGPVALAEGVAAGPFPPAERVVDTTAAGDSFNGGFLAAWLRGEGTAAAMLAGHMTAREVVGFRGAFRE